MSSVAKTKAARKKHLRPAIPAILSEPDLASLSIRAGWIRSSSCALPVPVTRQIDPQRRQAAQAEITPPHERARFQRPVWKKANHLLESNLPFDPRQRRAKTVMCAVSKGYMTVVPASDVQPIRIRKAGRIAVRCRHDRHDRLAFANFLATQLRVLGCKPRGVLAGTFISQQFFHCRRNQRKVSAELSQLFW